MTEKKEPKWVQPVVDYTGLIGFAGAYAVTRDLMQASWGLAIGSAIGLAVGLLIQRRLAWLPQETILFDRCRLCNCDRRGRTNHAGPVQRLATGLRHRIRR